MATTITRRRFINFSLYSSLSALAAATIYPIVIFFIPHKIPQKIQSEVIAAKIVELTPNSSKIFKFGAHPELLVLTEDGKYKAFSATCMHLDCIVQYRSDVHHIWRVCRNGHFDLFGKNISGPPPLLLEEYQINIMNDNIIVTKKS